MSYNAFEGIVQRTRSSAYRKLNKLVVNAIQDFIEPRFVMRAEQEEGRLHNIFAAASGADARFADLIQQVPARTRVDVKYKFGQDDTSLTVEHAAVSKAPMIDLSISSRGDFSWKETTIGAGVKVEHVEEIANTFLMWEAVAVELEPWTEQFRGKKRDKWGSEVSASWDNDKLSQMCAFSPLYRANLALRENQTLELRAYKHGPRTSDKKFMSPMLVKALTTTAHLPDTE